MAQSLGLNFVCQLLVITGALVGCRSGSTLYLEEINVHDAIVYVENNDGPGIGHFPCFTLYRQTPDSMSIGKDTVVVVKRGVPCTLEELADECDSSVVQCIIARGDRSPVCIVPNYGTYKYIKIRYYARGWKDIIMNRHGRTPVMIPNVLFGRR